MTGERLAAIQQLAQDWLAVDDFEGSAAIRPWYSDGAPKLHAVCGDLGIRHDMSNPHRSETNGQIERATRTVIEGVRCLLFPSGMPYTYVLEACHHVFRQQLQHYTRGRQEWHRELCRTACSQVPRGDFTLWLQSEISSERRTRGGEAQKD